MRGGDQRVHGHQAEGGRAVDQDQVPVAPQVPQRVAKRHLAPDLPRQAPARPRRAGGSPGPPGRARRRRRAPAPGGRRRASGGSSGRRRSSRRGCPAGRRRPPPRPSRGARRRPPASGPWSSFRCPPSGTERRSLRTSAGLYGRREAVADAPRRRRLYTARPFVPVARPLEEGAETGRSDCSALPVVNRRWPTSSGRFSPERAYRPRVSPPSVEDRDACAIYASVRKDATPSRAPVELALANLQKMLHRAGNVDGEGDGCGILVDIPRRIWAEEVRCRRPQPGAGARPRVRGRPRLHRPLRRRRDGLATTPARSSAAAASASSPSASAWSTPQALGATAREEEPHFWQVAGLLAGREAARSPDLRPDERARGRAGLPPGVVLGLDLRLQGDGGARGARRVLPRPPRRAVRDDRLLRPQPLLHQHLAVVQARAAVHGAGPQRRDQHDRAAPPGGRACSASRSSPAAPTPRT